MNGTMRKYNILKTALGFLALLLAHQGMAQQNTYQSVLGQHTWYRLSIAREGVYKLDYATFQAMGVDMDALKPNQIRLFGNPSGALPEKNSEARYDDLTEMALYVEGADDGVFDAEDAVLFYGQEPTRWTMLNANNNTYKREPNPYSDTTYYYLCVDSGVEGQRVGEKASLSVDEATAVIADFPDFFWHEVDLISPYSSGLNWLDAGITLADSALSIPFHFPNLVTNKPAKVKGQVLSHITKNGSMKYTVRVGDNILVNNVTLPTQGRYEYGKLVDFDKQCYLSTDSARIDISIDANPQSTFHLDYVEVYAWRQLKRVGDIFPFRLMPSQFGSGVSAVWVQNTNADYWLWEVTSPLCPVRQTGVLSSNNLVFATDEVAEKRYVLFKPSAALKVDSWKPIPNQNLHAIANAEMLIVSSPLFLEQAQALADYHARKDAMQCVVVNVEEIYNEFATGTPDPSGIRNFVRMVYQRSEGNLKYLTLFGRASFDFRDLLGYGKNFVPTYQTASNPSVTDFCTDDFFGLMDDNEGIKSRGYLDLGIGRLPVSTVAEAQNVVEKIIRYDDLSAMHGDWKADFLLVSDDEQGDYVAHNEEYEQMMESSHVSLTSKKIYSGVYEHVNTNSGVEIPGANEDLMRTFHKGMLGMVYTGHGGVRGLTGENVFTNADIAALDNSDRLPFVFTATCEFSKYDDPLTVSAGEHLFLNPNGGSANMLTTCRSTIGNHNVRLGKALMSVLYRRDREGKPMRFGDIVRMAKADSSNYSFDENLNIRFLFFGDPAVRFALPYEQVVAQRINGKEVENEEIALHAMSMVTLEGEIRGIDGRLDSGFNGEVWVRLFDKKTKMVVPCTGTTKTVYYHKDMLFRGQATVRDGKFTVSFQVPKDIMTDNGKARFSFYAYDANRVVDAVGKFDGFTLGGTDPAVVADDAGPTIKFHWNTPEFDNGQTVEHQGVLCADLYDAQGIYHYDYSLGRDIMLNSNLAAYNSLVLNDRYEPIPNDFRRGKISIPLSNLEPGTYEFSLRAWDTQDNASEASLWFVVADDLFLSQVLNFPNPFSDETHITLTHIGDDGNFDVDIEIFDVLGRPVQHLQKRVTSSNGIIEPILWNGCGFSGSPLRSGIYLYRLTLTDEQGYFRTVSQRMVIQR